MTEDQAYVDVIKRLDKHIDLINGLVEKVNQLDDRLANLENWKKQLESFSSSKKKE